MFEGYQFRFKIPTKEDRKLLEKFKKKYIKKGFNNQINLKELKLEFME